MKTIKLSLALITMLAFSFQVMAGKEEFKKTISKTFDINSDATLALKNKFGTIHCENWDKNTIAIEVEISVEAHSQEKANKYFDRIDVNISGSRDKVSVTTDFDDKLFNKNNDDISVDFMIHMPATVSIEVDHKFGDLILPDIKGSSMIELGYGSMKANRLEGTENELEIKFSEGYVGFIKNSEIELKYGELEIDEAGNLSAESKFSELNIGKVDVLTLESGYDDDFIGSVRDLDVEGDFSDVEVRSLSQRLIADFDYGELKVKEIGSNFEVVELYNSFSGASLGFHQDASFRLSATVKMGDLSYPSSRARLNEVELSFTSSKYEGVVGDSDNPNAKVIIDSKNSGTHIFYR